MATIKLVNYPTAEFKATGAVCILSLHDALYFEVPEDNAEEAGRIVKETMEAIPVELFGPSWKFPAGGSIGRFWGDPDALHF